MRAAIGTFARTLETRALSLGVGFAIALAGAAAALCAPRAAMAQVIAITGGKVYPVSGPPIENGTVVITNGKITAVGANVAVPAGARRVDASGKWVTPGLINAQTTLGVHESGPGSGYSDQSSSGDRSVAAKFKVWEGINPDNVFIPPQREAGVTTVGVVPSSPNGYVLGQAAVIDLLDGSIAQMLVRAPVAMVGNFGEPGSARATARGELYDKVARAHDGCEGLRGAPGAV